MHSNKGEGRRRGEGREKFKVNAPLQQIPGYATAFGTNSRIADKFQTDRFGTLGENREEKIKIKNK